MTLPDFAIEITKQGWINDEPESARYDPCSHGDIRVVIGGRVIAPGDGSGDYTISTSALALLRTLESDHSRERPIIDHRGIGTDHLVMHCGQLLMGSCPIGIDWSVAHIPGRVRQSDIVRCDSIKAKPVRFQGLVAEVAEDEYRRQVVAFAEKAKEPFLGIEKDLDDLDGPLYEEFWQEYEERLSRGTR